MSKSKIKVTHIKMIDFKNLSIKDVNYYLELLIRHFKYLIEICASEPLDNKDNLLDGLISYARQSKRRKKIKVDDLQHFQDQLNQLKTQAEQRQLIEPAQKAVVQIIEYLEAALNLFLENQAGLADMKNLKKPPTIKLKTAKQSSPDKVSVESGQSKLKQQPLTYTEKVVVALVETGAMNNKAAVDIGQVSQYMYHLGFEPNIKKAQKRILPAIVNQFAPKRKAPAWITRKGSKGKYKYYLTDEGKKHYQKLLAGKTW